MVEIRSAVYLQQIAQLKETYPLITSRVYQTPEAELFTALKKANKMLAYRSSRNLSTDLVSATVALLDHRMYTRDRAAEGIGYDLTDGRGYNPLSA